VAFQALRRTGLALSLGLTALAAYQGIRDAMADQPQEQRRRLDITGSREVVYCHHCENEWYRDENGLVCPRCDGEVTEIVRSRSGRRISSIYTNIAQISAENDPRPPEIPAPLSADELRGLREHDPWEHQDHDSDPEEGDIREFVRDNPQGRTTFISRTFRGSPREVFASGSSRRPLNPDDPASQTLRDFEGIISGILGPNTRFPGPQGEYRTNSPPFASPDMPPDWGSYPTANAPNDQPRVFGGRVTFQFGGPPPRAFNAGEDQGPQQQDLNTYAPPFQRPVTILLLVLPQQGEGPNEVSRILRDLMLVIQPPGGNGAGNAQNPLGGLHGLFAGLLNPANAVSGDAVYSQEALDRIISTLMEQHPTSNAPGPASAEAIAALPKKKIDEKMLGPEGKAECSVCMDDVVLDEEVVSLPCSHWFHEACVKAWLSEHNTCPICRTGVARDGTALPSGANTPASPGNGDGQNNRNPFEGLEGLPPYSRRSTFLRRRPSINETRLASIRNTAGLDPEHSGQSAQNSGSRMNPSSRHERSLSPPSHILGPFPSTNNRNTILRRQESDTDAGSASRRYHERNLERERNGSSEGVDRSSDRGRPGSGHSINSSNSMTGTIGSWFRRFSGGGSGRRND
jgi:E3 ubiquitin-protein ligase RNF115/126